MYAYMKGQLIEATPAYAIVDVHSIGYKLFLPAHTLSRLPQLGSDLTLFTSFVIRENSQALYGFLTVAERELFDALIEVSGVGPKLALSLCGHLPPQELFAAISQNDIPLLVKVPGVGKKTAERLILDLRDKVPKMMAHSPVEYQISPLNPTDQLTKDALSALVNLGYNLSMAQKAVTKTLAESAEELDLGDLITTSLRNI